MIESPVSMEGEHMKRVVVLGGTGMAGHVVSTYLDESGYDVYIASQSAANAQRSKKIDATDFSTLDSWLDEIQPTVIVNCIGVLQKLSEARPDLAILLNSYLPQHLAYKYKGTDTKLIHISTDCVFSGARGGYAESDAPDGAIMYDRSKALGEVINDKDLTFRMSIIGPDRHTNGTGLFHWFIRQKGTINGYSKAIWNGVTTIVLARAIDAAIRQNISGLYHLVPKAPIEPIDKYSLLLLFRDVFHKTDIEIVPVDNVAVDKTLINTRADFNFEVPSYPEQIKDMKNWIDGHMGLYDSYTCQT